MARLFLFLLFPAIELYLLVKVGSLTGAFNMVLWVFVSALLGIFAVRAQGQEAMNRVRADLHSGNVPQSNFLEGLLLFFGGVLLILPGLISDAIGLLLLLPFVRRAAVHALGGYLTSQRARNGASRVIFFRAGPGGTHMGGFGPGGSPMGGCDQPGAPGFPQAGPQDDPREPRQATIIDSTAIDVTAETPDSGDASSAKTDKR